MKQYLGHVVAFFAGVLLTVGTYETYRLIENTRQALSAASNQLAAEDGVAQAPKPKPRQAKARQTKAPTKKPSPRTKAAPAPRTKAAKAPPADGAQQPLTKRQRRVRRLRRQIRERRRQQMENNPDLARQQASKAYNSKLDELSDEELLSQFGEAEDLLKKVVDTGRPAGD